MNQEAKYIFNFFSYDHLPDGILRDTAMQCAEFAATMVHTLDPYPGTELTMGLRKLLEAKDCFVRHALGREYE